MSVTVNQIISFAVEQKRDEPMSTLEKLLFVPVSVCYGLYVLIDSFMATVCPVDIMSLLSSAGVSYDIHADNTSVQDDEYGIHVYITGESYYTVVLPDDNLKISFILDDYIKTGRYSVSLHPYQTYRVYNDGNIRIADLKQDQ